MILPCQNYFSFSRCFRDRFVEVSGLGWGLRKWKKRDSPCSMLFIHIRVICNGARNKKPEYTPSPSPAPVALCLALSVSPFLSERKRKWKHNVQQTSNAATQRNWVASDYTSLAERQHKEPTTAAERANVTQKTQNQKQSDSKI